MEDPNLRFVEGCHSIHEPISIAVLDVRTATVPLHEKIFSARIANER